MTVPSKVNFCAIVLVESEIETTPGYAVISIFDQTWKNRSYTWLCHHLSFECISTFVSTKEEEGAPKNDRNGRHWENCKPDFFPTKTNVQAKKEGEGASKNNRNGRHQENINPNLLWRKYRVHAFLHVPIPTALGPSHSSSSLAHHPSLKS
ncbi:hypothetical protein GUJ93_ZPchr0303g11321 [Zizania palustris]|uniref:Uncharacterized protein n=1 Tax=Zizania palustris TaxID=103762 RepID=A0A8J5RAZ2_ZIZPA|nr:hypothetical protein GUJ93_ZPchr0303g11321 [Zizania palustris]